MKLQRDLLLFQFLTDGLGGEFAALSATLKDTDTGRRADGQSHWFGCLEGRESRLKAPLDTDALRRYDLNILQHEATLADRRSGFQLKFFHYLALLYFEMFLDRLVTDRAQLLLDLEAFRVARFRHQAPVTAGDLGKLAFWMATGSGKTLLLHINYLQFLHYRPFKPANILLLAPSRGLAEQHLGDLETSGLPAWHALSAGAGYAGIQVLEITKLYKPQPGQSGPRSGESLPTDHFEGPNLLLVDEGHKRTASAGDAAEERAWRTVREAMAENGGFTIDQHLYQPLLLASVATDEDFDAVKSVPNGLVDSERQFILDLRAFWDRKREDAAWSGVELFLMRNLPKTGIGFFQTGGFFPDFLLWMRRRDRHALAFVEPHGIVHQEAEKLDMLGFIRGDLTQQVAMPLLVLSVGCGGGARRQSGSFSMAHWWRT